MCFPLAELRNLTKEDANRQADRQTLIFRWPQKGHREPNNNAASGSSKGWFMGSLNMNDSMKAWVSADLFVRTQGHTWS